VTYRVPAVVRPKVVCVFRRGPVVLLSESADSVKNDTFFGPPGGAIEFGETAAVAALREMREELGVEVAVRARLGVLENIFVYEGQRGHEIVFVLETAFLDRGWYAREEVHGVEADHPFVLRWTRPAELAALGHRLVPGCLHLWRRSLLQIRLQRRQGCRSRGPRRCICSRMSASTRSAA
jgi:8-oxo-dGTP pyrophosphatase MutT (NUDIX family)